MFVILSDHGCILVKHVGGITRERVPTRVELRGNARTLINTPVVLL